MVIVYPVSRLLENPKVFYAIANYLDGPDAETLREVFYSMMEFDFDELSPDKCEFDAEEVCFATEEDGSTCTIQLDTGLISKLEAVQGEIKAEIHTDEELAMTSAMYKRLVSAIEEADPDLQGDIALCSPPTPGNSYLQTPDGNHFVGDFHLLSDPDKKFSFNIRVIDSQDNELKATIKPI